MYITHLNEEERKLHVGVTAKINYGTCFDATMYNTVMIMLYMYLITKEHFAFIFLISS